MDTLHSIILELQAEQSGTLPSAMGRLIHAMFLNLIKQFDPSLSAHLHNEPGYRPFTLSLLYGQSQQEGNVSIQQGQTYRLRVTFLDGGCILQQLQTHFLEAGSICVHLTTLRFRVIRVLSTPSTDKEGRVNMVHWQSLVTQPAATNITFTFLSPTAFSIGNRMFELLPKPPLLWGSLLRDWNTYAPPSFQIEKGSFQVWVSEHVHMQQCDLHIEMLHFATHVQKGFVGSCQYFFSSETFSSIATTLATFAYYAGLGSKTTMGMGQIRTNFSVVNSQN